MQAGGAVRPAGAAALRYRLVGAKVVYPIMIGAATTAMQGMVMPFDRKLTTKIVVRTGETAERCRLVGQCVQTADKITEQRVISSQINNNICA